MTAIMRRRQGKLTKQKQSKSEDNEWIGEKIDTNENKSIRIGFYNTNGIKIYNDMISLEGVLNDMHEIDISYLGLSEINLAAEKPQVKADLREAIQKCLGREATIQTATTKNKVKYNYKPGGTAAICRSGIVGRIEPKGRGGDEWGRWTFTHLRRRNMKPLTIISAYQVCRNPTNQDGNSAWSQQKAMLLEKNRKEHPRKAFIKDLEKIIKECQGKGHDIIVGGDFNETIEEDNSGLMGLAAATDLVDPWSVKHPGIKEISTCQEGRTRIDLVLMSRKIVGAVEKIGYAPFGFLGDNSNHRLVLLELNANKIFGDEIEILATNTTRGLRSNDKKHVTQQIEELYDVMLKEGAFTKLDEIQNDKATAQEVIEIDETYTKASIEIEGKLKKRRPEYFSRPLVQQRLKVGALSHNLHKL